MPVKVTTKISIFFLTLAVLLGFPTVAHVFHLMKYHLNEESALESMRDNRSAQTRFIADRRRYGTLEELAASRLIRSELGTGNWRGYLYSVEAETERYRARAVPKEFGPTFRDRTGCFGLYLDESSAIRMSYDDPKKPSATDEPLRER